MQMLLKCDWCGKDIWKYQSQVAEHNYCSLECNYKARSKKHNPEGYLKRPDTSDVNRKLNPTRHTAESRRKLREHRLGKGKGLSYAKLYGRHEHRVVAEKMLGRPLRKGEVVHHIDRNKRNNKPDNLMVFRSQSEHVKWHKEHDGEEVMPVKYQPHKYQEYASEKIIELPAVGLFLEMGLG
ncbi:MAG: HNH endonuclease [Lachnospiraceae bacterium]